MPDYPKISVIGSGNVPWHLCPTLENHGYAVREVFSLDPKNSKSLVKRLYDAAIKEDLDFGKSDSEIFIISITDDAIEEIVKEIILPDGAILVHTSGTVSMEVLSYSAASGTGILYPLQTFSKNRKIDFKEIPILIEADNDGTRKILMTMGSRISRKVIYASSEERKLIHLAAVLASNFSNHMLYRAEEFIEQNGFDFELLKPLILETLNKSLTIGPANAQTGPARRGNVNVLEEHVELIEDENLRDIYRVISQDILNLYS